MSFQVVNAAGQVATVHGVDADAVIDAMIATREGSTGDRVIFEGGRVVAVIQAGRGGELPAIIAG